MTDVTSLKMTDEADFGVEAAGHGLPLVVEGLLVVDVYDVDFFHLTPFHAAAVEVGNAVGGQVGDLDTHLVVARLQRVLAVELEGYAPGAADELAVDVDAGRLADVAEVDGPGLGGAELLLGQLDVGGVDTGAHGDAGVGVVECLPGLGLVKGETLGHSG